MDVIDDDEVHVSYGVGRLPCDLFYSKSQKRQLSLEIKALIWNWHEPSAGEGRYNVGAIELHV